MSVSRSRGTRWALRFATVGVLTTGCTDSVSAVEGVRDDCALLAINSDYQSTSVALLNSDGTLCREPLLHSGSARAGLVTALSGDVVLPSAPSSDGLIRLIDRYPNAALTTVDTEGHVLSQVSVATGFASNPQDALEVNGALWVTRAATNPTPGREPFDAGGDILVLRDGVVADRIDLASAAEVDVDPMPGRMARGPGGVVAVGLSHLRRDFTAGGSARLALVSPDGALDHVLTLGDGLANCGSVVALEGDTALVVCTGVFADGDRVPTSGLVHVDLARREVLAVYRAAALGGALAFGVTPLPGGEVLALLFGDLGTGAPDRVVRVSLATGAVSATGIEGGAFELAEPLLRTTTTGLELLVPDAAPNAPRLRRFAGLDASQERESLDISPATGLPPRHLAWRLPPAP